MRGVDLYEEFNCKEAPSLSNLERVEMLRSPDHVDSFLFGWKASGVWHQQRLPLGEIPEDELKVLLVSMRLS